MIHLHKSYKLIETLKIFYLISRLYCFLHSKLPKDTFLSIISNFASYHKTGLQTINEQRLLSIV